MGIEELQEQQRQATAVLSLSEDLFKQLKLALLSMKTRLESETGLNLEALNEVKPFLSSADSKITIAKTESIFWMSVANVSGGVLLSTLECLNTHLPNDYWQVVVSESDRHFRTVSRKPLIPLRFYRGGRSDHLLWCGPEDNDKLASAFLDAFANRERQSEFTLAKETASQGCALLIAGLIVTVLTLASLAK